LDISVASGRVSVTAGIYFSIEGENSRLIGFVRASGALKIIGMINLTLEFYLGLGYERIGGESRAEGEAILTVEIEVLFFSAKVDLHYRKEFQGSRSDSKRLYSHSVARFPTRSSTTPGIAAPSASPESKDCGEVPVDSEECDRFRKILKNWQDY